jgi:hypothetical protein
MTGPVVPARERNFEPLWLGLAALLVVAVFMGVLMIHTMRTRAFLDAHVVEYRGQFVCPEIAQWQALPEASRTSWHAYWQQRQFAAFEKSGVCYVPPSLVPHHEILAGIADSGIGRTARYYTAIVCPKSTSLAAFSAPDLDRWRSIGAGFGPEIAESAHCFDP